MRKALKILHTLASCGLIGALAGYIVVLVYAPQGTPAQYADLRATISLLANYVLLPSLAVALVSGLLAMAVHRPFQDMRWVWVKAILGISMFEATLGVIQSKANAAADLSRRIAAGELPAAELSSTIATEWMSLAAVMALSVANVVLGVWRPRLKPRG